MQCRPYLKPETKGASCVHSTKEKDFFPSCEVGRFQITSRKFLVWLWSCNLVKYMNLFIPAAGEVDSSAQVSGPQSASSFRSLTYRRQWKKVCLVDNLAPHLYGGGLFRLKLSWLDTWKRTLKMPALWYRGSILRTWSGFVLM